MKFHIALIGILAVLNTHAQQAQLPVEIVVHREELTPDFVRESGDYKLFIYFTAKGTRSEGIFGLLKVKDKEVIGKAEGDKINTPFGTYVWHGPIKERKQLWDRSGWLPEDLSKIYPSWSAKKE